MLQMRELEKVDPAGQLLTFFDVPHHHCRVAELPIWDVGMRLAAHVETHFAYEGG